MRKSFFLRSAVLFLAAMSPAVVNAQFQPPAPEELKMTADPKAPGTDAVYLDIEEIANDPMHYQSYSARIKVLTEKDVYKRQGRVLHHHRRAPRRLHLPEHQAPGADQLRRAGFSFQVPGFSLVVFGFQNALEAKSSIRAS